MAKKPKEEEKDTSIAVNRRAWHDYEVLEEIEAGVVLLGWEVKSIREKKVQITQAHIIIKHGEPLFIGAQITPLLSASTHVNSDPTRTRKLLLRKAEIRRLIGAVERKGCTLIPLKMYWKRQFVKVRFALAKGKKNVDKRHDLKERDWTRQKQRLGKMSQRG